MKLLIFFIQITFKKLGKLVDDKDQLEESVEACFIANFITIIANIAIINIRCFTTD